MDLKEFGEYFAELRKEEGFKSQRDLADRSGISNATISRIESGTNRASPEVLREIANCFLTVSYEELLQKAGYDSIGNAYDEFQPVYDLKKKLGQAYENIAYLTRYCTFHINKEGFLDFLASRNLTLQTVFENFRSAVTEREEIDDYMDGFKIVDLEDAIRISRGYRVNFSDIFSINPIVESAEDIDVRKIYRDIDNLIIKDIEEYKLLRKKEMETNQRQSQIKQVVQSSFGGVMRQHLLGDCTDEELSYLYQQLMLYRGLRLQQKR